MKISKNNIKLLVAFILGGVVFGGIGVAAASIIASDVSFVPNNENWNVHNVEDAINSLYQIKTGANNTDANSIFFSYRKASSFSGADYGFDIVNKLDDSLFTFDNENNKLTVLKSGKLTFEIEVSLVQNASYKPAFQLVKNDEIIYSEYVEKDEGLKIYRTDVEVSEGDILYMNIAGAGNYYTSFVTRIFLK